MLPLGLFRSRQFSGANGVTFAVYGALGGALFLLPVELQIVKGYSPLEAGISLLPLTLVMLAFSARSGALSARIGPRLQMTVGPSSSGQGSSSSSGRPPGSYWTQVFPAVLLFAIGLAVTVAPLTATAMSAAPAEHSGVASAVNNVVARAASLLAVAVLPLLAGLTGAAALESATLAAGFRTAMVISGLTCAAGGVLAALTIRNPARVPSAAPVAAVEKEPAWSCGVSGPPAPIPRWPLRGAVRLRQRAASTTVGKGRPHAAPRTPDAVPAVFAPAALGPLTLRNRIIKAATFEGVTPGGTVSDRWSSSTAASPPAGRRCPRWRTWLSRPRGARIVTACCSPTTRCRACAG